MRNNTISFISIKMILRWLINLKCMKLREMM